MDSMSCLGVQFKTLAASEISAIKIAGSPDRLAPTSTGINLPRTLLAALTTSATEYPPPLPKLIIELFEF